MKTLANCSAREFMRQTAKIRHAVEKWLSLTDIMNIRRRQPEIPADASIQDRAKLEQEQAMKNLRAMFDVIMDEHPDETLDILAMCCFVEPEHVDDYTISEYLSAAADMIEDENVMRFFTSLMRLGRALGLTGSAK